VDLDTYRRIPWEKNTAFFLVDFLIPDTKAPLPMCPRNLLKRVINEFHELGLDPMCGAEFEFFQFDGK
jgi:glutamine synthetase